MQTEIVITEQPEIKDWNTESRELFKQWLPEDWQSLGYQSDTYDSEKVLESWLAFYANSPSIEEMNLPEDETSTAFKLKEGLPVKVSHCMEQLGDTPLDKTSVKLFESEPMNYVIPLASPEGRIFGFITRSLRSEEVQRRYSNPVLSNHVQLFGFEAFGDYPIGKDKPIILCEGIKDCIFLQGIYPYCLAILGSEVKKVQAELISRLTKDVLIAFDGDRAGKKATKEAGFTLAEYGVRTGFVNFEVAEGIEDWGSAFVDYEKYRSKFIKACRNPRLIRKRPAYSKPQKRVNKKSIVNACVRLTDIDPAIPTFQNFICPFHVDTDPSARLITLEDGTQRIKCYGSCKWTYGSYDYLQKVKDIADPYAWMLHEGKASRETVHVVKNRLERAKAVTGQAYMIDVKEKLDSLENFTIENAIAALTGTASLTDLRSSEDASR